jgi:Mn2+/Fe2+ NRAMP family transporter
LRDFFKNIGPGPLIAAAFIGPGTVTVCTLAGVRFGYTLLWAMGLSIIATIFLQEMAARLGVISQKGLAELLRTELQHPILKFIVMFLVLSAILVGNAAYEAGNISGGVLGVEALFGAKSLVINKVEVNVYVLILGAIAFVALYIGNYRVIERFLVFLVILMSVAFLSTAILTKPDWSAILSGLFMPELRKNSLLTVIALIGTTVVPYNLFLHTSLAKTKWTSKVDVKLAKRDTVIAVVLGGFVSMSIIISAAGLPIKEVLNASDLAASLEPVFGANAKYLLSVGLFAAGITSAITAPLAAAYVASGCLGWPADLKSKRFRIVWIFVLGLGVLFSTLGFKPIAVIKFAQVANGLLLPIVAIFLLLVMNNSKILGKYVNSKLQNVIVVLIILLTFVLGVKGILSAMDSF